MSLQKSLAIWVTAMAFSACITAVGVFGVRPASAQTYPQTFTLTPTSGTDIIFDDITLTQYSASSDAIYHHVHLEAGETLEYQLVVDTSELTYTASEGVNAITNTGITGFEVITTTDETAQSLPLYGAYQELITEDPPNWDLAQTYNFLHWYLAPGNEVAATFHKFECQGNRTPLSVWYKGYCSTSGPTYIDDGEAVHYDGNGGFYNWDFGFDWLDTISRHWSRITGNYDGSADYDTWHFRSGELYGLLDLTVINATACISNCP